MKKWVALVLILLVLSGCSWQKVKKWSMDLMGERRQDDPCYTFHKMISVPLHAGHSA